MEKIFYTLIVAGIGGLIALKLKIPAGAFVGSMLAVAAFNITTGKGHIPLNFKLVAQMCVGGIIGLNFTLETIKDLKELIFPALVLMIGLMLFSILLGFIISKTTGLDLTTALFSSAPGGVADMTILSEAYGADTPKVALLHLVRLITVITVLPVVIKFFTRFIGN